MIKASMKDRSGLRLGESGGLQRPPRPNDPEPDGLKKPAAK